MHLNNAHLFTPLYLSLLPGLDHKAMFLRALLAQFIYYYLSRGRPGFSAANFAEEHAASSSLTWEQMFEEARGGRG